MLFQPDFCSIAIMNSEKKHCFRNHQSGWKRFNRDKKSSPLKSTSRISNECTQLISASLLNLEGSYARNKLKE